ncbi:hypothetical protein TRFO_02099 [Tritrichomonas foetus]|uniref:Uncharacterized protein n=1 Tax=Tritrichomonas foetus TaxID=1144522 RepID=A0A1J4JCW8_9EUKA|nr:hypothetical protein TRFO_02099 [Tritrichomonas foetus]|eukprot:OHS96952.1 hypothetical protein TRFO_02099 [Tritrichomonas foetus]
MSLLTYDLDDTSSSESFEDFKVEETLNNELRTFQSQNSKFKLPPPKRNILAPAPPPPIEITTPQISKILQDVQDKEEIIELNSEEFKNAGVELAEQNAMIKDRTQYNGVGYDRNKSQLTYLARLDQETNGAFEQQMKNSTRGKLAARKMYGW